MVGEIRDGETAELAIHAALTGHIVLSTLHTNNAIGVIPRLIDMGVQAFLLPPSLNLMAAQRLLPKLCQECKKAEPAPEAVAREIKDGIQRLPKEYQEELKKEIGNLDGPYQIYHSPGCEACKGKGIKGRIAIFEVLEMTRQLEDIINASPTESKILEEAKRQGMVSLRQDGIIKALKGLLSMEEVLRETMEM
jgi:type II secretory ATPase GspE/PulE/Tfp pilus assembly ATPase PilB-like protein